MALVHTVVLQPRAVVVDAFNRFRARPLPLWIVGFVTLLPNLHSGSSLPTDLEGWQVYLAHLPSPAELQLQIRHSMFTGAIGLALSALAWPIITLLTQGAEIEDLQQLMLPRIFTAARAFATAVLGLATLTAVLLAPALVAYVVTHQHGTPFITVPGIDAVGFWSIFLMDALAALLVVAMVGGALLVVPAEACARPDTATIVVRRSWLMCRDYLSAVAMVLLWLQAVDLFVGAVADLVEGTGVIGNMLSWSIQAFLATMPPLAGASLHASLSQHAANHHPAFNPSAPLPPPREPFGR